MPWTREQMAARAAKELRDGFYVNLGIGIPTLVSNYIPAGMSVQLQSENGMLGFGPFPYEGEEDPDLINAGKQTVTEIPTTSYFSSADSFGMIRGGHIDLSIVHAWKADTEGNLVYRKTARNFNPMMATAARVTVAEVENLVEPGSFDPDHIITPGVYVQRIVHVPNAVKHIEQRTVRKRAAAAGVEI